MKEESIKMAHCSNCPKLLDKLKHEKYVSDKVYECIKGTRDSLKDALEVIIKYCPENDDVRTYLKASKIWLEMYAEEKVLDERRSDNAGQV